MNIAGVHYGFSGVAREKTLPRFLCGDQRQTSACSPSHFTPVGCKLIHPRVASTSFETHARPMPKQIKEPSRCERRVVWISEMTAEEKGPPEIF